MCPGNNESAGKHHSGKLRKGDPWLRGVLGEIATTAARSRINCLGERHRRLAACRGKKRALVATGHSVLVAAWHLLTSSTDYVDLGADHYRDRPGSHLHRTRRLLAELQALGYHATLRPTG